MNELEQQISALTSEKLTPYVRKAIGKSTAKVMDWAYKPISWEVINPVTAGITRLTGMAVDDAQNIPWSIVLKCIQWMDLTGSPLEKDYMNEPTDWNYWKREALAYKSGILDKFKGNLVTPRCYGVLEQSETSIWLWLEDIQELDRSIWNLDRHILAAKHFGEFNGTYVANLPSLTDFPWLCTRFIQKWIQMSFAFGYEEIIINPDFWNHSLTKLIFSTSIRERVVSLSQAINSLTDILDQQTRTLSHQDTHFPNIFNRIDAASQTKTIVIDWSYLGLAAIGEDLGNQIAGNLFNLYFDPSNAQIYYADAINAYMDGLRQSGWNDDRKKVEFACATAGAIRYVTWGILMLNWMIQAKDAGELSWFDSVAKEQNRSFEDVLGDWDVAFRFLLWLGEEAQRLAPHI